MQGALKIDIGSGSFTSKEITVDTIRKVISAMLDELGIGIDLDIMITDNSDFLTIDKQVCDFPASLPKQVGEYILLLEKSGDAANHEYTYWQLLITNIIWMQPQLLFSADRLPEYMPVLQSIPGDHSEETHTQCKKIIDEILNLKISMVNKALIAEISTKFLNAAEIDWNDFREELVTELSKREIGIFFNQQYFDQVITANGNENLFGLMRDGLFYETGLQETVFKIYFDSALPYNTFYFRINNFMSIPVAGLRDQNEIFVNDTPDRLYMNGITGRETMNPANGQRGSMVSGPDKEKLERSGLNVTVWGGAGYFILCFTSFFRKQGYLYIDKTLVSKFLDTLKAKFPKVVELIEHKNLQSLTVTTLRLLAKEEISIGNFRFILQAILESGYIIADDCRYIIFDERMPVLAGMEKDWQHTSENIAAFVRTKLKKYISNKYGKGQNSLIVYLLDSEIEKTMAASGALGIETRRKIMDAVDDEIGHLPAFSDPPVLLTTVSIRFRLRNIIEKRYPQVAVLSYQELSPEINIQPTARITLR